MENLLELARNMLDNVTPLQWDCGALCGKACCQPDDDGKGGALLFPGERAAYEGVSWARVVPAPGGYGWMLMCDGPCPRGFRPLACRIFPLTPVRLKDGSWSARIDRRARPICPLCHSGMNSFSPDFVKTVKEVVRLLATDEKQREFLERYVALEKQYTLNL